MNISGGPARFVEGHYTSWQGHARKAACNHCLKKPGVGCSQSIHSRRQTGAHLKLQIARCTNEKYLIADGWCEASSCWTIPINTPLFTVKGRENSQVGSLQALFQREAHQHGILILSQGRCTHLWNSLSEHVRAQSDHALQVIPRVQASI